MPPSASTVVPASSPSFRERLHARWLVFTQGPAKAWQEAVETRNLPLAQRLHETGVSAKGLDASTIVKAVEMGGSSMLRLVLDSKANPNQREREGMLANPMQAAALLGSNTKVKMLVEAGGDINIRGNLGVTPLAAVLTALATRVGPSGAPAMPDLEATRRMVLFLLDLGASAKGWAFKQRESLLRLAPLDLEILDRLVLAGANPRRLLNPTPAKGCRPREGEQALLFRAVEIHDLQEMDRFLGHMEKSPYRQGPHTQGREGRTLVFEMIRAWAPPPSSSSQDPQAQWDGLLDLLVARGHDLRATDKLGNTVLHEWAKELAPSFHPCGMALLRRPEVPGLLAAKNKEGRCPLELLTHTPGRLDGVPGGWEMLARATQDHMEGVLAPPVPVRTFHLGGRL